MRREHHGSAGRHLVQFLHKNRAFGFQAIDDKAVMDNFMPHINRAPVLLERELYDLDRPINASAKATRGGEQDGERRFGAIWFSHRQCHLGNVRAKAKDFPEIV
jgi:hypothetical protein